MSTGAGIAVGVAALAVVGVGAYLLTRPPPVKTTTQAGVPAASGGGNAGLDATIKTVGTTVDSLGKVATTIENIFGGA